MGPKTRTIVEENSPRRLSSCFLLPFLATQLVRLLFSSLFIVVVVLFDCFVSFVIEHWLSGCTPPLVSKSFLPMAWLSATLISSTRINPLLPYYLSFRMLQLFWFMGTCPSVTPLRCIVIANSLQPFEGFTRRN